MHQICNASTASVSISQHQLCFSQHQLCINCASVSIKYILLYATLYKNLTKPKGIAFPTTVSPRNFVCNLSPLDSDPEASLTIQEGDVVRVELGVHIDGYIAQAAKTV